MSSLPRTCAGLLQELKRSVWIPEYDHTNVRKALLEIDELFACGTDLCRLPSCDDNDPEWFITLSVYHRAMCHLRSCLLAYHVFRCARIVQLRWDGAGAIPADNRKRLTSSEGQFADEYDQILAEYMGSFGGNLDLTVGSLPPKDLHLEVRVPRTRGSLMLESGVELDLRANETHFLKRSDVEPLIRQGLVEHVANGGR
mmetsp:Transcript_5399/g.14843  ORF Transcript_5399/g.14843 Transcript_5399/m.14843 type:complete len:199 (+) Transcript_5399:104-700(+)